MTKNKGCRISGYNLYLKDCSKETSNFSKCLTDRGWKNKLSDKERDVYNQEALKQKEQCLSKK